MTAQRVLVVDDEDSILTILGYALGQEGYEVFSAHDAAGAEQLLSRVSVELVILDLTMPGMNGLEVLNKIRQVDPNAHVIIGTADVQDYSRLEAERMGSAGFVTSIIRNPAVSTAT